MLKGETNGQIEMAGIVASDCKIEKEAVKWLLAAGEKARQRGMRMARESFYCDQRKCIA
jgi:hypothetical protein